MSKIVASQSHSRFLLQLDQPDDERIMGQVIDTQFRRIWPPQNITSILARGYWEPVDMSQEESDAIVGMVEGPLVR